MTRKYDLISELYRRTAHAVVSDMENWQAFLRCACRNYRLRFDEQLLIYAQRPNAMAVLEIERWNDKFGRWVNRGAKGIAVFEDANRSRQRLTHYFDISDTHGGRYSRPVPIWDMKPEYADDVIESLENTFGELENKESLADAVLSAAKNAVEDNIPDYLGDLMYAADDSFLYGLSEDMITAMYKKAVTNSVAYMMMTRLGIDTEPFFEAEDFSVITNFNTPEALNALGIASSDIAEMGLGEISRTVLALERQNRIIADREKPEYNKAENKSERSFENERADIHNAGRLQSSRLDNAQAAGSDFGQVRSDETEISQGTPQNPVLQSSNELHPDTAFGGNRADSDEAGRNPDEADGGAGGLDREPESGGYDEVGTGNEQSEEQSAGDRESGDHLRLDYYDRSNEDKSLPFFGGDDTIREILGTTPHLKASKEEIRAFYESNPDNAARTEYIKGIFNNDYTELILSDGRRVGYKTWQNVLQLWEGSYLSRTKQSFYDWGVIAQHFEAMRLLGELQDTMKPLPSVDGQLNFLDMQAEEKTSAFSFSQEIIDAVLTRGSGISEGKFRIYEQFEKSFSTKENADFLKDEYGWGGAYPVIVGAGIDEQHDGKGILISKGIGDDKPHIRLNWNQVEKRIAELIRLDRYLNPKEKEIYPQWLEKQEERRAELAEEQKNREILSSAPPKQESVQAAESEPQQEAQYAYHLGDMVYMGADEYEILAFDDKQVRLFDTQFPLFNKEMDRAEFDRRVRETPMNDHLKVKELPPEEKTDEAPALQGYNETKASYPNDIVLYQMGDFFEAYGADAQTVSEALELNLASRSIGGNQRTQMCGFPANHLETYVNMLLDRGFDVVVSSLENGERSTRNIVSTNKEDPVQSQPVGRINYLHTDGTVRESVEYTSPYQFEKDIKEENYYGVPMGIVLYKDEHGNVIPHEFISELDPPPQSIEFIDSPYLKSPFEIAKQVIDEYCYEEFEHGADFSDLKNIGVGYTTTEDEKHEIQARVNLVDYRIETLVDDKVIRSEQFSSLESMIQQRLLRLAFDELVSLSEEEIEIAEQNSAKQTEQKEAELFTPAFSQPKRSRVQTFDLHPEIPLSERHTFDLASHEVPEAGKKERFSWNMEAIRVLKECEFDNRFATPEEQEILSQYVGWGGIPEAFDENNSSWADEFIKVYTALSPDEYESARASTLTAFYTPPVVISSIYKAMEQMGFREGNILEPSCGIGNFIGMLPQSMQDSKIYGVEIDKISAGIAQQLYQKTSIAAQPFEEANIPDSFFDAVIGNVPFGDIRVNDRRYNKHNFLIHDYFFAKSLDKLRPGGVMALITSKGTMDKENPAVRKYIAQRADLLGAIRLPNNTFKGNAGTEVVSDILILQKRDRLIDLEPEWVHLNIDENGVKMNAYFVDHPEMVLGEWKTVSGRFGEEDTVIPYENADLAELLDEAISNIHAEITDYEVDEELTEEDNSIPADPEVRNFSYTVVDDKIYYRENSRMTPVECSATAENRIKGMITIRDCVRSLIEMQTADYPDYEVEKEQQKLNALYDNFSKKYGLINSRANVSAFSQDSSFALLSALEVLDENGELERKADMFTKRTIKPHTPVTSVDTVSEALAVSMGEKACVDMEYMCSLTGKTEQEIYEELKGVIFLNPMYGYGGSDEQKYLMADEYLSGNVREKLAWAKKSAEVYPEDYNINVEALEKVQPKDLTASEIFVQLGTTWLPEEIAQQFMYEFLDTPVYARWNIKVHYSKLTDEWNVEGKSYDRGNLKAYNTYGTKRVNAYKIIEDTLNMKDVRVFDYIEDDEGKKKAVLNKKETAIAQSKQELIKQGFQDWVWRDPARREKLVRLYNDKFNSIRPREYDGSHIIFSGMNPEIELREHQKNAVAHILYGGNTLLAHAVGAGKTFEMTAAAMESKRLGLCNKSLFVVPNHLTEQWAAEFLQLYPAANILVATKKDFEMKNRKRFCGRIATGDYDAVIIGHSQFEKIPISIERQRAVLQQQLDDIIEGIADIKRNRGDRFSVKQLEKTKKSLQTKLEKLNDQSRKDDVVTFEELGIDRLFIDESHYYKNLYLYTKMRNVGGIAQTEAQKSSDLFMKCRYLDEITGGRGVVFATGTPISNSMVELYTIQRYLQYRTLQEHDLQHFDAWASMFGETVTAVELTPEGTGYRAKTRFAKFNNLPELMAMFKQVADIKTADMLNLPVPEVEDHNIAVKPSQVQKEMVASLGERAEKIRGGNVDSSVDNMLKVTNDGRKLALDQRMMNPMLPDEEGSKVNTCVNEVFHIWEETLDKKLTQILFCDLSTPKGADEFSVYTDIRKKLMERGVPQSEIKFIHEADTETKKQELFKKVRRGEVRILIGSTQKMGAGTNVQNKIIASHDLDCPWRPADLEQRAGRTVRQGNENPKVGLYRYVTEGTFDAYCWQLVEGKQKFASQIMTSKSPVRSCEDVDAMALSYAEIKMLAADNPHIKEKMDLDIQVQKLRLLKSNYLSEKYELEDKIIKYYPTTIARIKETIAGLEKDISLAKEHPKPLDDTFVGIEVKGVSYSEKAEGGQKIIDACKEMTSPDPIPLGKYRGFDLELSFDTFEKAYQVKIKGSLSRSVSLGTDTIGNITRIDNAVEKIPERLEAKKQELETIEQQFAIAKTQVEKPFDRDVELTEKTERLNVLNSLLNVDKHENEIIDMQDESKTPEHSKERDHER